MAYKQHFIEWFSGKSLPSYWGSTGTVAMSDEVDGGLKLSNSGGTNGKLGFGVTTDTGAVYSHTGCKMISVAKVHQFDRKWILYVSWNGRYNLYT